LGDGRRKSKSIIVEGGNRVRPAVANGRYAWDRRGEFVFESNGG
jgi:hypothetical protein